MLTCIDRHQQLALIIHKLSFYTSEVERHGVEFPRGLHLAEALVQAQSLVSCLSDQRSLLPITSYEDIGYLNR